MDRYNEMKMKGVKRAALLLLIGMLIFLFGACSDDVLPDGLNNNNIDNEENPYRSSEIPPLAFTTEDAYFEDINIRLGDTEATMLENLGNGLPQMLPIESEEGSEEDSDGYTSAYNLQYIYLEYDIYLSENSSGEYVVSGISVRNNYTGSAPRGTKIGDHYDEIIAQFARTIFEDILPGYYNDLYRAGTTENDDAVGVINCDEDGNITEIIYEYWEPSQNAIYNLTYTFTDTTVFKIMISIPYIETSH